MRETESAVPGLLAGEPFVATWIAAQPAQWQDTYARIRDANGIDLRAVGTAPLLALLGHIAQLAELRDVRLRDDIRAGEIADSRYLWLTRERLISLLQTVTGSSYSYGSDLGDASRESEYVTQSSESALADLDAPFWDSLPYSSEHTTSVRRVSDQQHQWQSDAAQTTSRHSRGRVNFAQLSVVRKDGAREPGCVAPATLGDARISVLMDTGAGVSLTTQSSLSRALQVSWNVIAETLLEPSRVDSVIGFNGATQMSLGSIVLPLELRYTRRLLYEDDARLEFVQARQPIRFEIVGGGISLAASVPESTSPVFVVGTPDLLGSPGSAFCRLFGELHLPCRFDVDLESGMRAKSLCFDSILATQAILAVSDDHDGMPPLIRIMTGDSSQADIRGVAGERGQGGSLPGPNVPATPGSSQPLQMEAASGEPPWVLRPIDGGQASEPETLCAAQAAQQAGPRDAASELSSDGDTAESEGEAASTWSDLSVRSDSDSAVTSVAEQHEELLHCLVRSQVEAQATPVIEALRLSVGNGEPDDPGVSALLEVVGNLDYADGGGKG